MMIIQVSNEEDPWYGAILIVDEECMGGTGYLAYCPIPTKGPAYYRIKKTDCEVVGEAIIGVPGDTDQ